MEASKYNRISAANLNLFFCMAMVSVLLIWNVVLRIDEFDSRQTALTERSTAAAASEIALLIRGYQRSSRIFTNYNQKLLSDLADWPQDIGQYTILEDKVDEYFPDNFTFTLATKEGQTLLEGFEGLIGKRCRRDIYEYSKNRNNNLIHIHQGPEGKLHHFDIMSLWDGEDSTPWVFFISFKTEQIKRILANAGVLGHQLLLVSQVESKQIEVQNRIPEDRPLLNNILTAEELDRISEPVLVQGTLWNIVSLSDENLYSDAYWSIFKQTLIVLLGFLFVSLILRTMMTD